MERLLTPDPQVRSREGHEPPATRSNEIAGQSGHAGWLNVGSGLVSLKRVMKTYKGRTVPS